MNRELLLCLNGMEWTKKEEVDSQKDDKNETERDREAQTDRAAFFRPPTRQFSVFCSRTSPCLFIFCLAHATQKDAATSAR